MKYYQVTLNNDTKELFNKYKRYTIINDELYTQKELEKIKQNNYWNFETKDFKEIQWNKQKTVFVFGKRVKIEGSV